MKYDATSSVEAFFPLFIGGLMICGSRKNAYVISFSTYKAAIENLKNLHSLFQKQQGQDRHYT